MTHVDAEETQTDLEAFGKLVREMRSWDFKTSVGSRLSPTPGPRGFFYPTKAARIWADKSGNFQHGIAVDLYVQSLADWQEAFYMIEEAGFVAVDVGKDEIISTAEQRGRGTNLLFLHRSAQPDYLVAPGAHDVPLTDAFDIFSGLALVS